MMPVGGLVQPGGGLPESPESKRRMRNLIEVTGLMAELDVQTGAPVTRDDLLRVHPAEFLDRFQATANAGGGETGLRAPYGPDGYEIACLSAGLAKDAVFSVLDGAHQNAYALSRPPGHHCLPDWQNGFCLLANIAIAVEAALAEGKAARVAVLDWDVHHGNGTEAIFYDRSDVLTVSIHQDRNYPVDTGDFSSHGTGAGVGFNLNIPLPPGGGHHAYLAAMERLALPAIRDFAPDILIIACGFDPAVFDPLGRMMASVATFRAMTEQVMALAGEVCDGRLAMVHEGGYSEAYVPFCGHAVVAALAGSQIDAPDPFADVLVKRQPDARFNSFLDGILSEMEDALSA